MITLLTGENNFEIERAVAGIVAGFSGEPERYDGVEIELKNLPDLLMGVGLFSEKRLVVIKNLSANKSIWSSLPEVLERKSEDIHLVLVEPTVDKRTKTYKLLQKQADIKEYKPWGDRDMGTAEKWANDEAKRLGLKLGGKAPRLLVERSLVAAEKGVIIDQWRLVSHLEKLATLKEVGQDEVGKYIEESPVESVFSLLETALKGDSVRVRQIIERLETSEDPFRLFGLLSGQVFWLAALSVAERPSGEVAKELGAHPYVLGKLDVYVKRLGKDGVKRLVGEFAEADGAMKRSVTDPWLLIERALLKAAIG